MSQRSSVRDAMEHYFAMLLAEYQALDGSLPLTACTDVLDPRVHVGSPNAEGWIHWRPTERDQGEDWNALESEFGIEFHPSFKEYYDSFWFAHIGGSYEGRAVELHGVIPVESTRDLVQMLSGYASVHGGLERIPIGFDASRSLLLVVNNRSGVVEVEDDDRAAFVPIAPGLAELVSGLSLRGAAVSH